MKQLQGATVKSRKEGNWKSNYSYMKSTLCWEAASRSPTSAFLTFYGTRNIITVIKRAHRCSLLIILIMFGEEYELRSFLQPPTISTHFDPNILFSKLSSNTFRLYFFLNIRDR
jgi:hypothetical protein